MITNKLNRTISILLALLVLCTSTGYSIDLHYCKGHLKSISLIGKAKSCHESSKQCPMHASVSTSETEDNNCCSNEKITFDELDSDYTSPSLIDLIDAQPSFVLVSFQILAHDLVQIYQPAHFKNYRPPLPSQDIRILQESFLI